MRDVVDPDGDELDGDELAELLEAGGVVYTAGVSSAVLDGEECVGHTLLLDVDDVDRLSCTKAMAAMDGVSALFESSPGSFHIWQLSVREWEDAILDGLSWGIADAQHVQQSYRRGRYILRATAKVRDDTTHYKAAPQLLDVAWPSEWRGQRPQSLPHMRRLEAVASEQNVALGVPDVEELAAAGATFVGAENGLGVDRYMTLTDEGKRRVRGGE